MYEFISVKVKCPVCNKSLMDDKLLVDNIDSIKFGIAVEGKKGTINLSSIYGSYNFRTDLDIPKNAIAEFSCPHCKAKLATQEKCTDCDAPMIKLYLHMGGKVTFCSRNGCKKHSAEFEDLTSALRKFYHDYGFRAPKHDLEEEKEAHKHMEEFKEKEKPKEELKEIIKTGTFLYAYCPHCRKSLIEDNMLKLRVVNGDEGDLLLSPYLNIFSSKSSIYLSEEKDVKEIKCPHCHESLINKDDQCDKCKAPTAKILVSASTKMVEFYICSRKGCRWHGLSDKDMNDIRLEDSMEW